MGGFEMIDLRFVLVAVTVVGLATMITECVALDRAQQRSRWYVSAELSMRRHAWGALIGLGCALVAVVPLLIGSASSDAAALVLGHDAIERLRRDDPDKLTVETSRAKRDYVPHR
jgi:hypothetical protein